MPDEIILLTGGAEGPHLANILTQINSELSIECVESLDQLQGICQLSPHSKSTVRRLIAYCTDVIVPTGILQAMTGPAYNFHPGPPAYPGAHAASFAIYDGARKFGVCAHEMAPRVDSGSIVGVEEFGVPENARFLDLEILAYKKLFQLFGRLADNLASRDVPLDRLDISWGDRKTRKADFARMKVFDADMDEAEIRRRWRAFG